MEQRELLELTEKGVKDVVNKIENSKAPTNDCLTKEFFETLLLEIKNPLFYLSK